MGHLRIDDSSPYRQLIGVGGVGSGIFFELEGEQTLGRNESRLGRLLDVRDYCKLHIVIHYVAKLLGAQPSGEPFKIVPIAKVGEDASGQRLVDEMRGVGIETSRVEAVAGAPTLFSVCFQYGDGSGGNITTSNSAAALLSEDETDQLSGLFQTGGQKTVALAVPEVPLKTRRRFLEVATRGGAFRVASFASAEVEAARDSGLLAMADLVSLNQSEAEQLVGTPFSADRPADFLQACQEFLRGFCPDLRFVITAGRSGAYGITAEGSQFCRAVPVKVASTAGAGDALLGAVIAATAAGIPFLSAGGVGGDCIESALQFGVLLGSYTCQSPHTIHPQASLDELLKFASRSGLSFSPEFEEIFTAEGASGIHAANRR